MCQSGFEVIDVQFTDDWHAISSCRRCESSRLEQECPLQKGKDRRQLVQRRLNHHSYHSWIDSSLQDLKTKCHDYNPSSILSGKANT